MSHSVSMMPSTSSFSSLFAERSPDVQPNKRERYLQHASQMWDTFYTAHAAKFYKDRHYFEREWPELTARPAVLLEVGCGAGNTIYPLLDINPGLKVYACDFSHVAVGLVKSHPNYSPDVVHAFVADLTSTDLCQHVPANTMDFATCVFVLSALQPHSMPAAVANMARTLRPGGQLLFRDYAEGDLAQEKREAAGARRLGERFFLRGDGTCCYHFQPDELRALFAAAGLKCTQLRMHERDVENRKRGIVMHRRWVQATFTLMQTPPPFPLPPGCMSAFPFSNSAPTAAALTAQAAQPSTQQTSASAGSPAGAGQAQAAGEERNDSRPLAARLPAGTWLTGAAARLASHATLPPGVPSGRAQLPDTLESADELVCTLSPRAAQQHGQPHRAAAAAPLAGALQSRRDHLEESNLEQEFFATIGRRTEDVVAEEVAAAGIAGITLMDVSHPSAGQQQQQQQAEQVLQPPMDDDMDLDGDAGSPQDVCVQEGVRFLTTDPAVVAVLQSYHAAPRPSLPAAAQHGTPLLTVDVAQAEFLLARLLLQCSGNSSVAAARLLQQAMQGGYMLQLAIGPGALAGMCAVRHCGARRALLTHPSRCQLEQAASCVHVNAPRLVIERLRLAQLDQNQEHNVSNVLQQVGQHGGASLVVCADWLSAVGAVYGSAGQDATALQDLPQRQLLQLVRLALLGQQLPSRSSAVSALAASTCQSVAHHTVGTSCVEALRGPKLLLLLAAGPQCHSIAGAASAAGWAIDDRASAELQQLLLPIAAVLGLDQLTVQPCLLRVKAGH